MKKVLIGVGIGCGLLLLIVVGVVAAGGMWAKSKLDGVAESTEKLDKHQERVKQLDEKYAFAKPPKGEPVKLSEARVKEYMAIRAALGPVMEKYGEEGKALEQKTQHGKQAGFTDAMKAGGLLMDMMADVQGAWLDQLDQKKMSPQEFHAITAALLTADMGKAAGEMTKGQRQMLTQMKAVYEQQANAPNMTEEARADAKSQLADLDKQLAALPKDDGPTEAQKIHAANAELFAKYKAELEKTGNMGIDMFLLGSEGSSFAEAMESATPTYGNDQAGDESADEAPAEEPVEDSE